MTDIEQRLAALEKQMKEHTHRYAQPTHTNDILTFSGVTTPPADKPCTWSCSVCGGSGSGHGYDHQCVEDKPTVAPERGMDVCEHAVDRNAESCMYCDPQVGVDPKYRMLEVGEVIREGDEFTWDLKEWFSVHRPGGPTAHTGETEITYRRRVVPEGKIVDHPLMKPQMNEMDPSAWANFARKAGAVPVEYVDPYKDENYFQHECQRLRAELDKAKREVEKLREFHACFAISPM